MTASIKTRMRITLDLYLSHSLDWPVACMAPRECAGAACIAAASYGWPRSYGRATDRAVLFAKSVARAVPPKIRELRMAPRVTDKEEEEGREGGRGGGGEGGARQVGAATGNCASGGRPGPQASRSVGLGRLRGGIFSSSRTLLPAARVLFSITRACLVKTAMGCAIVLFISAM